jgi:hypothetical protein
MSACGMRAFVAYSLDEAKTIVTLTLGLKP